MSRPLTRKNKTDAIHLHAMPTATPATVSARAASGQNLAPSEDEKGSGKNCDGNPSCKAPACERDQGRRRSAVPHLVDLLFGNGRIAGPIMGEHVGAQHRNIAVAELVGIGGFAAEAGHEGLFP